MITKNKTLLYSLIAVLIISTAMLAVGCQPARRPAPQRTPEQVPQDPRTPTPMTPQDRTRMEENPDLAARADRIADNLTRMQEIQRATVVISERTALVGVNIAGDARGELTTEIKRMVENEVRRTDRNIENVAVSADADVFTRIQNMGNEIRRGRPLSGFAREIEELIRRIAPTSPAPAPGTPGAPATPAR